MLHHHLEADGDDNDSDKNRQKLGQQGWRDRHHEEEERCVKRWRMVKVLMKKMLAGDGDKGW